MKAFFRARRPLLRFGAGPAVANASIAPSNNEPPHAAASWRLFGGPLLLVPVCAALFFHELTASDLWSSHEARAAQNAQGILDDGDWALPHLFDGQAELQKPPAFYWLTAGVAKLRGGAVDRWAVRLPAAITGLLTVLLVWHHLAARGRPLAGTLAGLTLASAIHFTSLARTGRIDMPLTCAVTAALLLLDGDSWRRIRVVFAGLFVACAIMLKGPIGVALPLAIFGARSLAGPGPAANLMRLGVATLLGALLALPWFIAVNERTGGEFFRVFFWHHNIDRALGEASDLATHPWWYYAPRFAIDFLPWTPLLLALAWRFARVPDARNDQSAVFGLIWLLVTLVVLSFAQFKRADYLLPAFPGAALFIGCVGERWYKSLSAGRAQAASIVLALIMTGALLGWWWFRSHVEPRQQAVREQQAFALHVRQACPAPQLVLMFRAESHLLAFHLGQPIRTLVEWGELNELLARPGPHWFITRAEFVSECFDNVRTRRIEVAARSADFTAAAPLRKLVLVRTIEEPNPCPTNPPKD
jgi:4-amino-4-deoxy-L-arabinose transferase-like glycosyltransferase